MDSGARGVFEGDAGQVEGGGAHGGGIRVAGRGDDATAGVLHLVAQHLVDPRQRGDAALDTGQGAYQLAYRQHHHDQGEKEGDEVPDGERAGGHARAAHGEYDEQRALGGHRDHGLHERIEAGQPHAVAVHDARLAREVALVAARVVVRPQQADRRERGVELGGQVAQRALVAVGGAPHAGGDGEDQQHRDAEHRERDGHEARIDEVRHHQRPQRQHRGRHDVEHPGGEHLAHEVGVGAQEGHQVAAPVVVVARHRKAQHMIGEGRTQAEHEALGRAVHRVRLHATHHGLADRHRDQQRQGGGDGGRRRGRRTGPRRWRAEGLDHLAQCQRLHDRQGAGREGEARAGGENRRVGTQEIAQAGAGGGRGLRGGCVEAARGRPGHGGGLLRRAGLTWPASRHGRRAASAEGTDRCDLRAGGPEESLGSCGKCLPIRKVGASVVTTSPMVGDPRER